MFKHVRTTMNNTLEQGRTLCAGINYNNLEQCGTDLLNLTKLFIFQHLAHDTYSIYNIKIILYQ